MPPAPQLMASPTSVSPTQKLLETMQVSSCLPFFLPSLYAFLVSLSENTLFFIFDLFFAFSPLISAH
jgi:4-hydroxybenzoate polyprenyltransferase